MGSTLFILGAFVVPVSVYVFFLPSPRIPTEGGDIRQRPSESGHWDIRAFMFLIAFFILFTVGTECTMTSWLPTFLFMGGLTDEANAAYFASIFWTGCLIGRTLSVFISTKMKPHSFVRILLLITLIASFGFVFFQKNIRLIMLTILIVGSSSGSTFPNMLLMIREKMPLSGKMNGIVFAFTEVGAMLVPWFVGQVLDRNGAQVFPPAVLIQICGALILLAIIQKKYPTPFLKAAADDA